MKNTSKESQDQAEMVLTVMREAIAKVPAVNRSAVIAIVYRKIGVAHFKVKPCRVR